MIQPRVLWLGLSLLSLLATQASAQEWPEYFVHPTSDPHDFVRGPGFYLAMYKLISIALVFLFWVRLAAWVNKDAIKVSERSNITPEFWNPFIVFPFLVGFLFVISFPFFFLGFPLYLLGAVVPVACYAVARNRSVAVDEQVFTTGHIKRKLSRQRMGHMAPVRPEEGSAVTFTPATKDPRNVQACLISLRQNPAYFTMKEIFADALTRRVDQLLFNYTKEKVGIRFQVDGIWHDMPAMDRELGDALLYGLKQLADLDPTDRRSKQSGSFEVQVPGRKLQADFVSQGIATGERALIKLIGKRKSVMKLRECGMLERMENRLRPHLNQPGLVVVSTLPSDGYTTTWNAVLESSDRIMRDFCAFAPATSTDTQIENIEVTTYQPKKDDPNKILKTLLLKQPEALVLPETENVEALATMLDQVLAQQRFLITRIQSRSSAEAVVRLANLKIDRKQLGKALKAVVYSRLVRRLCENCKQPFEPPPELLKKLGVNPGSIPAIYREWQPPPPEELVDKRGRPIEPEICPVCGGLGYLGRIAIFELVEIDDAARKLIATKPTIESLNKAYRSAGNASLQEEGLKLVLAGITSIEELQRVLKASQA